MRATDSRLVELRVRRQGEELDVLVIARDALEELRGLVVPAFAKGGLHLGELFAEQLTEELDGDLAAVFEQALRRANPLPDLRARDLCSSGVFHQVEDRDGALTAEPRAEVLDAHRDVVAQARFGDRLLG